MVHGSYLLSILCIFSSVFFFLFFIFPREKLTGTDWTLVTTSDAKKYYYNAKTKVKCLLLVSAHYDWLFFFCLFFVRKYLLRSARNFGFWNLQQHA